MAAVTLSPPARYLARCGYHSRCTFVCVAVLVSNDVADSYNQPIDPPGTLEPSTSRAFLLATLLNPFCVTIMYRSLLICVLIALLCAIFVTGSYPSPHQGHNAWNKSCQGLRLPSTFLPLPFFPSASVSSLETDSNIFLFIKSLSRHSIEECYLHCTSATASIFNLSHSCIFRRGCSLAVMLPSAPLLLMMMDTTLHLPVLTNSTLHLLRFRNLALWNGIFASVPPMRDVVSPTQVKDAPLFGNSYKYGVYEAQFDEGMW